MSKLFTLVALLLAPLLHAQTVLTYSDHEPYGNMRTRFIRDVFFKNIEHESQGRIIIQAHWKGEIAKAHQEWQAVQDKKTDIIVMVPEYSEQQLPLHQLFKSFLIGPSGSKQVRVLRQIYRDAPELTAEYEANGVTPILIATGYPVAFFSPQKFNSLQAIQAQTWRSASFWHRDYLANAGAKPITTPWNEEVAKMLGDGRINGLMVNIDSALDINAHQYAPYALVSKNLWLGHIYPVVIRLDRWNSLTAQDQQAIRRAAEKSYAQLGKMMAREYLQIIKIARSQGVTLRELSRQEIQQWAKDSQYQSVQDKWASEQEANGVAHARKVLAILRQHIRP